MMFLVEISSGGPRHSADTAFIWADSLGSPWEWKDWGEPTCPNIKGGQENSNEGNNASWPTVELLMEDPGEEHPRTLSQGLERSQSNHKGFTALIQTLHTQNAHTDLFAGHHLISLSQNHAQFTVPSMQSPRTLLCCINPASQFKLITDPSLAGELPHLTPILLNQ